MTDHPFAALPDRGKEPTSKRNLDAWIQQAQPKTLVAAGRLGWLVASTVVVAALQRNRGDDGHPRFLLKGGAYLEVRLGLDARATKDIYTLFRGDFDDFMNVLDATRGESWGAIELQRTEVQTIECARRVVKPRRFKVKLLINGQTWRSIDVEVAADEGSAGAHVDLFAARAVDGPPLGHFGLPSHVEFAGIVFDYQVAQKLHACTDPHEPPDQINERAGDLVDLLLIRDAFYRDNTDRAFFVIAIAIAIAIDRPGSDGGTDFIGITCFGPTARAVAEHIGKGHLVAIQGRLRSSRFEQDGQTIHSLDVIANRVEFLVSPRSKATSAESAQDAQVDEEEPF